MFRRMVTPALTICKEMIDKGRMMSGKEMKRYFISEVFPDIVDFGDIANDDGKTIYMHKFDMFEKYSKIMNFSSLHHILLLESILWDKHKWVELFPGTHVCEIEGFHMVIDRPVHSHNTKCQSIFFLETWPMSKTTSMNTMRVQKLTLL